MQNKHRRKKYTDFHNKTSIQNHTIGKDNFTYRIIIKILNKYLVSGKKVLDIGCGAGTMSFYMASKGNNVVGIDIANNAIKSCKESAIVLGLSRKTSFKTVDFPKAVPNGSFDFILCSEVIEHLENDDLAFKKMFSLLKQRGIAIISTPSKNAPLYRLGLAKEFDKKVGHLRRYYIDNLIDKCRKCGFEVLETQRTEGIVRNFLFLNPIAGKLVRLIRSFLSDIVTFLDGVSIKLFGESQVFVVLRKP